MGITTYSSEQADPCMWQLCEWRRVVRAGCALITLLAGGTAGVMVSPAGTAIISVGVGTGDNILPHTLTAQPRPAPAANTPI